MICQQILGDPLANQTYYHMWWGLAVFIVRVIVIIWFFLELRATYQQENDEDKLVFYKVFGFMYCLWFLYLPLAVIIVSQINQFIRAKTLIGEWYTTFLLTENLKIITQSMTLQGTIMIVQKPWVYSLKKYNQHFRLFLALPIHIG